MLIHEEPLHGKACPAQVKCPQQQQDFPETHGDNAKGFLPPAPPVSSPSASNRALSVSPPSKGTQVEGRPFYDVIGLIMSTASPKDRRLMDIADKTWLNRSMPTLTFKYFYALCHDEPAVAACRSGEPGCIRDRHAVAILPCTHGYKFLTSKSVEGYRYMSSNFDFNYAIKVDADSLLDLDCLETSIENLPSKCHSFGMGLWRAGGDSKVFAGEHVSSQKYDNHAFLKDTGARAYPPYMTGWALIWSADVARFLGMGGVPGMPKWRNTWTIDDAAIGTFVLGLDICHLKLTCPVWTEQSGDDIERLWQILHDEDKIVKVGPDNKIAHYDGPFADDVPDMGDLYNLQARDLGHCSAFCSSNPACRSFEFSPSAGAKWDDPVKNCQIATGTNLAGAQWRDFSVYIRRK